MALLMKDDDRVICPNCKSVEMIVNDLFIARDKELKGEKTLVLENTTQGLYCANCGKLVRKVNCDIKRI